VNRPAIPHMGSGCDIAAMDRRGQEMSKFTRLLVLTNRVACEPTRWRGSVIDRMVIRRVKDDYLFGPNILTKPAVTIKTSPDVFL